MRRPGNEAKCPLSQLHATATCVYCVVYTVLYLFRDSLGWLVELIVKFLQFQPELQQKFFNCQRFDYSVVVLFKAWQFGTCLEQDYKTVVETLAIKRTA